MKSFVTSLFLLMIIFGITNSLQAQYKNTSQDIQQQKADSKPKQNRWFAGGMIGGGFSNTSSYVSIEPLVGYRVTPAFHVGVRLSYIFNSFQINANGDRANLHSYGLGVFGRYVFLRFLMAQVEFETLNLPVWPYTGERLWVPSLFIGGGYFQQIGGRGFATVAILYNVLENENSPYSNPLIRIGFGVGF